MFISAKKEIESFKTTQKNSEREILTTDFHRYTRDFNMIFKLFYFFLIIRVHLCKSVVKFFPEILI